MAEEIPNRLVFQHRSLNELKKDLTSPDLPKRNTAMSLLWSRYQTSEIPEERKEAGKILGYSDLRIKAHEYFRKFFR